MKKCIMTAMLLACVVCRASAAVAESAVVDRIVAQVNGEIITLSDLERYKSLIYLGAEELPGGEAFNRQILTQLIDKKVIQREAEELEVEVRPGEVDATLDDLLKRNNMPLATMEKLLASQGATLQDYRNLVRSELIQTQVIGREVQSKITITEKDMQEYYARELKPRETPGARVRLQQILLLLPADATEDVRASIEKSINDIRDKIVAGESFGKMAATYSQGPAAKTGGDLGFFNKGEMLPAIEAAAFSMEEGQVSRVIETPLGYHIIKLLAKDLTEAERTWEDHAREIQGALYKREFDRRYQEWMEGLKKKSYIEINY